jgi:hypothetical protein
MNEFELEVNDGLVESDFELTEVPELEFNDKFDDVVQFETNVFFDY